MTVVDVFDKGGIIVWILLAYSLLAMIVVTERLIHYYFMQKPSKDFEDVLHKALLNNNLETELEKINGPESRLLQRIVEASKHNVHDLKSVANRFGSFELQAMQRGFRTISILGNTAPLLGLLGTIIGMIKAFMVIEAAGGQVNTQVLAGGIWEAMLTTGVGLVVAIPVLLLLHLLEGMADKRAANMKYYSMLLLETISQTGTHSHQQGKDSAAQLKGVVHAV